MWTAAPTSPPAAPRSGEPAIAKTVDKAIHDALASGKIRSPSAGKIGMGTREVGDFIAKLVSLSFERSGRAQRAARVQATGAEPLARTPRSTQTVPNPQ